MTGAGVLLTILNGYGVNHESWIQAAGGRRVNPMSGNRQRYSMIVLTPGVTALMPCCILTAPGPRSFLLREKFENRARLEVKAFVVVDGKDLNSRIGLYAQRRLDLMRRPLGRPSAPP